MALGMRADADDTAAIVKRDECPPRPDPMTVGSPAPTTCAAAGAT